MLRNKLDFAEHLIEIILPEMIYTILITLFFYKILVRINLRLKQVKEADTI
jgi:rod shape-determining protein MreD